MLCLPFPDYRPNSRGQGSGWGPLAFLRLCYHLNPRPGSYEVTSTKYTRDIYKELLISLVASLFMGFGVLFLLLWVGIYV